MSEFAEGLRSLEMKECPGDFKGSLEELCERYVIPNLPTAAAVESWHSLLLNYIASESPLFLIRYMSKMVRGKVYETIRGDRFRASDNAPAWWFHYQAFHQVLPTEKAFREIIWTVPTHFFEVAKKLPTNISTKGWHVAHIFDVKTGDTNYADWSHGDVVGRFLRNVHPCNYFFVPKNGWQKWGGDERVIGYFATLYKERYATIWADFCRFANADDGKLTVVSGPIAYEFGAGDKAERAPRPSGVSREHQSNSYSASRLTFKANVIEPLAPHESFSVETPRGKFSMTKAEFYRVFSNVTASRSYRERGIYHYPVTPKVAMQFLESTDGRIEDSG